MILLAALSGLLLGWLVNMASDVLPRFANSPVATPGALRPPALLALVARRREAWQPLHLGVEIVSALVMAYLWSAFGLSTPLALLGGSYLFFLLIALIDIKYRLVLNVVVYPAIILVILAQMFVLRHNMLAVILGGGLAFAIFFLTATLKPGQLGMGDVKLAALIGFTFGFPQVLWAFLVGAGAGAAVAVALLLSRRGGRASTMPYAPFLCLGAMAALLYNPLLLTL